MAKKKETEPVKIMTDYDGQEFQPNDYDEDYGVPGGPTDEEDASLAEAYGQEAANEGEPVEVTAEKNGETDAKRLESFCGWEPQTNPYLDVVLDSPVEKAVVMDTAKRMHTIWLEKRKEEGWEYGTKGHAMTSPMITSYENLSDSDKKTYIDQATNLQKAIFGQYKVSWRAASSKMRNIFAPVPFNEMRESLCEIMHDSWARNMIDFQGYTYGPAQCDQGKDKTSPDLLPYSMLPEDAKTERRDMVEAAYEAIHAVDMVVLDTKRHMKAYQKAVLPIGCLPMMDKSQIEAAQKYLNAAVKKAPVYANHDGRIIHSGMSVDDVCHVINGCSLDRFEKKTHLKKIVESTKNDLRSKMLHAKEFFTRQKR